MQIFSLQEGIHVRKNIFDTITSLYDIREEITQLQILFYKGYIIQYPGDNNATMYYLASDRFNHWSGASTCINLDAYISKLNTVSAYRIFDYDFLPINDNEDIEEIAFGNVEFYLNMFEFCKKELTMYAKLCDTEPEEFYTDLFLKFRQNIEVLVDHMSAKIVTIDKDKYVIVPNDEAVTTVVEGINDEGTKKSLLIYNHFSMKGDLDGKATILRKLFVDVDDTGNRSEATDDFRFIVNEADVRHNNTGKKKNRALIGGMDEKQVEELYDLAYRLFVCGKLADEYKGELKSKVAILKSIASGNKVT